MKNLKKSIVMGLTAATLALTSIAQAAPVEFSVSSVSFTSGSGYGVDANENAGTLLDVVFSTNTFLSQLFSLTSVGDTFSFDFGSVQLREPDTGSGANAGIRTQEQDNLDVTATFTFGGPLGTTVNLFAVGTAVTGLIADAAIDYTLIWAPVTVDFGLGGQFGISMNALSFDDRATLTQRATIRLLAAPQTTPDLPVVVVPEASSVLLLGLGLAGIGLIRRQRRA